METTLLAQAPQAAASSDKDSAPRSGILTALWIPFDGEGSVDRKALARHLDWLKESGVQGVLALGSTGEFIRMTLAERERVLAVVMELAHPLPVIANLTSIRLDEVAALGRAAVRLGAVGAAIMPPHFFPVSQADMLEFFLRAADSVPLPFYLYNFPELTGNRIGIEVVSGFADKARMAGIKQSGGEFAYHKELIALGRSKKFSVFSGADTRLAEVFGLGADGCIGGLVNIVPEYMLRIFQSADRRSAAVVEASERMVEVGKVADALTFPLNVACGIEARGFDPGPPKTVVAPATQALYGQTLLRFRALFKAWDLR